MKVKTKALAKCVGAFVLFIMRQRMARKKKNSKNTQKGVDITKDMWYITDRKGESNVLNSNPDAMLRSDARYTINLQDDEE